MSDTHWCSPQGLTGWQVQRDSTSIQLSCTSSLASMHPAFTGPIACLAVPAEAGPTQEAVCASQNLHLAQRVKPAECVCKPTRYCPCDEQGPGKRSSCDEHRQRSLAQRSCRSVPCQPTFFEQQNEAQSSCSLGKASQIEGTA